MRPASAAKNCHGSGVNPRPRASGEIVSAIADGDHRECRQRQHAAGPAAQERHSAGADREDDQRLCGKRFHEPAGAELDRAGVQHTQHQPECQEVEQRADRTERQHEPADECDVPMRRRVQLFVVDAVGGDRQLRGVVEQVVQQDLAGQHRQERQQRRGRRRAEHVAEIAGGPHQHVLDGVGEDPPALGDTGRQHPEILLQQHHVGGVLGHIGRGVDGDPTSAACSASASLTPSPRKPTDRPVRRSDVINRAFCSGETRAKIVWFCAAACEFVVIHPLQLGTGDGALGHQTQFGTNLFGDPGIVAGGDLDLDAQRGQLASDSSCGGLGLSANTRNPSSASPHSSSAVMVVSSGAGLAGHGHHPAAGGEQRAKVAAPLGSRRRSGPAPVRGHP